MARVRRCPAPLLAAALVAAVASVRGDTAASCDDVPPPANVSPAADCAQRAAWNQCGQPWLESGSYCRSSCLACPGDARFVLSLDAWLEGVAPSAFSRPAFRDGVARAAALAAQGGPPPLATAPAVAPAAVSVARADPQPLAALRSAPPVALPPPPPSSAAPPPVAVGVTTTSDASSFEAAAEAAQDAAAAAAAAAALQQQQQRQTQQTQQQMAPPDAVGNASLSPPDVGLLRLSFLVRFSGGDLHARACARSATSFINAALAAAANAAPAMRYARVARLASPPDVRQDRA